MDNHVMEKIEKLVKEGRSFRNFEKFEVRLADDSKGLIIEGIACVFNQAAVIYNYDGIEYKEVIDARAFDGCNMSDVIFNYNHFGKVIARTRNKTLQLSVETDGLHIRAQLDGTEEGRRLYEEIKGGYIDRMSYMYSVEEESYNSETHTRTILKVKKLYDVAAVDIPAYNTTSLNARSLIDLDKEMTDNLVRLDELRRKKLLLKIKIIGGKTQ